MTIHSCVVIGSGPAGIGAAHGLIQNGFKPTIIDIGEAPPPEQVAYKSHTTLFPDLLHDNDYGKSFNTINNLASKLKSFDKPVLGSTYYIDDRTGKIDLSRNSGYPKYSLSRGGFTCAWGAASAPYLDSELSRWPIDLNSMKDAYQFANKQLNVHSAPSCLDSIFGGVFKPNLIDSPPQIQQVLELSKVNADSLSTLGIHIGPSRLALSHDKCIGCKRCLNGCALDLITNVGNDLDFLISNGAHYINGKQLISFSEHDDYVILHLKDRNSGLIDNVKCKHLFLGAGVVQTSKIVLASLSSNNSLEILDSQYFLFPALLRNAPKMTSIQSQKNITLSGAFIEVNNDKVTPNNCHVQIYSWSDLIDGALHRTTKGISSIPFFRNLLSPRLVICQGYLHSNESSKIIINLNHNQINLRAIHNPETKKSIKSVIKHLKISNRYSGLFPIQTGLSITEAGRGFHLGGSLPMRNNPSDFETFPNGLLFGHKRVSIIDSSSFPEVCSSTIALTIFANSYRITKHHTYHD